MGWVLAYVAVISTWLDFHSPDIHQSLRKQFSISAAGLVDEHILKLHVNVNLRGLEACPSRFFWDFRLP